MTDISIESAQQWIMRLEAELSALQAHPDYRNQVHTAEGIRQEIARVQQVAFSRRGRDPDQTVSSLATVNPLC